MSSINQEILVRLIDRLDSYPVGLPNAPEIRDFFNLFLSQDEAHLASIFPFKETTSSELAKKIGWPIEKVESNLELMASKGTVIDFSISKKSQHRYWLLTPSVVGFIEFSLMKLHQGKPMKEIAKLLEEYEDNHLFKEVFGSKTPITRALVALDVPISSQIMTTNEIEELIKKAGGGTVQDCYCRHHQELLDNPCKVASHTDTCFTIGKTASDFMVRRGFGKRIDAEEMITRIRELGKKGLIHVTDNIRHRPSFICNCCGCCCGLLAGINKKKIPHAVSPTSYILQIDKTKCNGCSICNSKCQIKAISINENKATLDQNNCLGCGSCIQFCKKDALSLVKRDHIPKIPKNSVRKFLKIAFEKKKLSKTLWKMLKARFQL